MKKLVLIGLAFLITTSLSILYAQKTVVRYAPDDDGTVYTSVEAALKAGKAVYRLKLAKLANRDSLPEELFQLTELRELTVKGCRLCRLNQNIGKLTKLQYLNLDHNKLLRLPESIGRLSDLRTLVISRNILEELPESIGSLRQLATIDAWGNPLYVLPNSIGELRKTLRVLDLRQIPLTKWEYEAMEQLLPETDILFTDICECENRRDHD
ncbi:MAG: leucine-rich repeat domain-containing protein [Bacteroidales bacterium]|nr:leucine-rich repeat domain-containing protein [Bacteroidales bacterium]